jgi:hypothetical protein
MTEVIIMTAAAANTVKNSYEAGFFTVTVTMTRRFTDKQ